MAAICCHGFLRIVCLSRSDMLQMLGEVAKRNLGITGKISEPKVVTVHSLK